MGEFNLAGFLTAAVLAGVPLLFGTLGEILTEKSGNLNLGVEGMMFMGAVGGLAGPYFYEQAGGTSRSSPCFWDLLWPSSAPPSARFSTVCSPSPSGPTRT